MALNEMQKRERAEYLERNLTITECSQHTPYVFISYASDDWEKVFKTAVVPLQKRYGMRVYADKAFDRVNDRWIVPMLRNVRGAEVVLAFVSQSYIESYACFLEMLTAVNSRRQIVFVALDEDLHLGDTTDQPALERGVKSELMNQGANMVTNINSTANDIMRAMKSAYTNISTLVEQDALSKYDVSDAFINFFRDAAVNRKSINDLSALRHTVRSVSERVFDPALAEVREPAAVPQGGSLVPGVPNRTLFLGGAVLAAVLAVVLFMALGGSDDAADSSAAEPTAAAQAEATGVVSEGTVELEKGTYEGQLLDGVPEGQGKATYTSGSVYEGEWKAGKHDGQGKLTYASGEVYEGEFKAGLMEGQGKMTYADGSVYEGEWKDSRLEGQGKYTFPNGDVYEGEWKAGKQEGQGKYTRAASGDVYEGEWKAGDKEGQGRYTYAGGDVYEGEWKADRRTGTGVYYFADGSLYEGGFKESKREGKGTYINEKGVLRYTGGWVEAGYSGIGVKLLDNEGLFVGYFAEGKTNGAGIEYHPDDGTATIGYWKAGSYAQETGIQTIDYDGGAYTGELSEDGVPEGFGILIKENRKKIGLFHGGKLAFGASEAENYTYYGELKEGRLTGYGAVVFESGTVAVNDWEAGKRTGYGLEKKTDGTLQVGVWKDDKYTGKA